MLKLNTILGSDMEAYFHDDWLKIKKKIKKVKINLKINKSLNSEIDFFSELTLKK